MSTFGRQEEKSTSKLFDWDSIGSPPTPLHEEIPLNKIQNDNEEIDSDYNTDNPLSIIDDDEREYEEGELSREDDDDERDNDDEGDDEKLGRTIKQKPQLTQSTVERIVKKQVKEEYNEQHQQNLLEAQKIQAEAMSKQYEAMAAQNEQHQQKLLEAQKIQAKAMSDLVDKIFENQNTNAPNVPNGPNNPFKCPDIPKTGRKNSSPQACSTSKLKRPHTTEDQSNFSPIKKSKNHAGPFNPDTKKILRYHFYEYNKENDPEELKKPSNFVYRTIEAELEYKGLPSLEYLQIAGQFKKLIKNYRQYPEGWSSLEKEFKK